jgi:hypothetical protein
MPSLSSADYFANAGASGASVASGASTPSNQATTPVASAALPRQPARQPTEVPKPVTKPRSSSKADDIDFFSSAGLDTPSEDQITATITSRAAKVPATKASLKGKVSVVAATPADEIDMDFDKLSLGAPVAKASSPSAQSVADKVTPSAKAAVSPAKSESWPSDSW